MLVRAQRDIQSMCGHGLPSDIFTGHTIPFGFHHGDGIIDHIGGVAGDPLLTMIIIHIGDLTDFTIQYVILTEWFTLTIITDPTELLR